MNSDRCEMYMAWYSENKQTVGSYSSHVWSPCPSKEWEVEKGFLFGKYLAVPKSWALLNTEKANLTLFDETSLVQD